MSINIKNNILLAFTGMLFSIVHCLIKEGEYPFDSLSVFLFQWLIHYFIIGLMCAFTYGIISVVSPYFYPDEKSRSIVVIDKYITIYLLAFSSCLMAILFAYYNGLMKWSY